MADPEQHPWSAPEREAREEPAPPEPITWRPLRPAVATPWRRLGWTLLAPLGVALSERIIVPGIDEEASRVVELLHERRPGAVGQLGLAPILTGFVLVELLTLVVPAWRARRHGDPAARARFTRVALGIGLVVSLFQAWAAAGQLAQMEVEGRALLVDDRPSLRALQMLLLGAAPFGLYAVAKLVEVRGLLNGISALLLSGVLLDLLRRARETWLVEAGPSTTPVSALLLLAGGWLSFALLAGRRPWRVDAPRGILIPGPVSGGIPLVLSGSLLALPGVFAMFGWAVPGVEALLPGTPIYTALAVALVLLFTALLAVLFNPVDAVARLYPGARRADAQAALRQATLQSSVLLALWSLAPDLSLVVPVSATAALVITAVVLDGVREWQLRSAHPELRVLEREQRPYAAAAKLRALEAAGVPALARGLHHRTLLQFFGPYLPIELLVPAALAEQGATALRAHAEAG